MLRPKIRTVEGRRYADADSRVLGSAWVAISLKNGRSVWKVAWRKVEADGSTADCSGFESRLPEEANETKDSSESDEEHRASSSLLVACGGSVTGGRSVA
jgi:hypothetical protein